MKKPKFKIGDTVETITTLAVNKLISKIREITIRNGEITYKINGTNVIYTENRLKLVEPREFTLSDLQDWDIVETRNGNRYIVNLKDGKIVRSAGHLDIYEYDEDMTFKKNGFRDYDIMKIYRDYFLPFSEVESISLNPNNVIYERNEKWKPNEGEMYYLPDISNRSLFCWEVWHDDINLNHEHRYEHGLVFKTKEEAIEAAKKILAALEVE